MKNMLFPKRGDEGVAIIAVVLTITLVTALFVMAFTDGLIGRIVTNTHSRGRVSAQCTQGAFEIARAIIVQGADYGTIPDMTGLSAGVVVTIDRKIGPDGVPELVSESRENKTLINGKPLSSDDPRTNPDIIVTSGPCTTNVDIDYVFHDYGPPGEEEGPFASAYHLSVGGTACTQGDFYYITAITTNGTLSVTSRSAYFKCL